MSRYPAPTRKHHEKFCMTEGWTQVTDARGRAVSHHATFTFATPQGDILRTRISHPIGRETYAPSMWAHILRDQLHISADEFWACVLDGVLPDRGAPNVPDAALPLPLVARLVRECGLSRTDIARLGLKDATALLAPGVISPALDRLFSLGGDRIQPATSRPGRLEGCHSGHAMMPALENMGWSTPIHAVIRQTDDGRPLGKV